MYEIADDYLAFWFSVLRDDADLIEGGQGSPVRQRTTGTWHRHIGRVLESAARDHVRDLVRDRNLPPDSIVGRWWRDETAEIDVCAVDPDDNPVLVGECKWQAKPFSRRDLSELRRKAALIADADATPVFALWSRGGARELADAYDDVRSFTCDDLLPTSS